MLLKWKGVDRLRFWQRRNGRICITSRGRKRNECMMLERSKRRRRTPSFSSASTCSIYKIFKDISKSSRNILIVSNNSLLVNVHNTSSICSPVYMIRYITQTISLRICCHRVLLLGFFTTFMRSTDSQSTIRIGNTRFQIT